MQQNQQQQSNNIKYQRENVNQIMNSLQHQRNQSDGRNQMKKGNNIIQKNIQQNNELRYSQNNENIQFNVNRIEQGSNCQMQYFFPKTNKKNIRNQTPSHEHKISDQFSDYNSNQSIKNNLNIHNKFGNQDFKITQIEYCEVDLNLIQRRENPKKIIANSVASSVATNNIKDLLKGQKRSSSQKQINHKNINNNNNNNSDLSNTQMTQDERSNEPRKNKNNSKNYNTKTPTHQQQLYQQSNLTPSQERNYNSQTPSQIQYKNKRPISHNKINNNNNITNQTSNKKIQQNKQIEFRLPSKSSLQNERKKQSNRYRIKTVGNEEDEDDGLIENFNINDLDDNDTPISKFNQVQLSNQKIDKSDKNASNKYPSRLKISRVQGNISEGTNLINISNKGEQKQLGGQNELRQSNNDNKEIKKVNSSVGRQQQQQLKDNNKISMNKLNQNSENQGVKLIRENSNSNQNNNIDQEVNRQRVNSQCGIRKRILTKSSEKLKQNLQISLDVCCDGYQAKSNNINNNNNNIQIGGAATTYDSKGSTKHTNTIKFSSRIDSQISSSTNQKRQQNNNISSNQNNNNNLKNQRVKTEGDEQQQINFSPYNPSVKNGNNLFLLSNRIDEESNFSQGIQSAVNNSQISSTKSHNSVSLHFPSQKQQSLENCSENKKQLQQYDNQQNNNIPQDNQQEITSPQFLKLRFKNTSSITQDRTHSAENQRNKIETSQEFKRSSTLSKKNKLMIKTINPYKSAEKKEMMLSQSETPQSAQNSSMRSSVGNNFGLFRKSVESSLPKSPLSIRKNDNNQIIYTNKQNQLQNQIQTIPNNNLRESYNNEDIISYNQFSTLQHNIPSSNSKRAVDWAEITSPNHNSNNNLIQNQQINSNPCIEGIDKKSKIVIRPTRVTSNERKNNSRQSSRYQQSNNNNNVFQSAKSIKNNEDNINNPIFGSMNLANQNLDKDYFSLPQQQLQNYQFNKQNEESIQQNNYTSVQYSQNSHQKTNEFRNTQETFLPSEKKEKLSSYSPFSSTLQTNTASGKNFNFQFYQQQGSINNDYKEVRASQKTSINNNNNQDEDIKKQKQVLEQIKSNQMQNMLRQSIEKCLEQKQQQQQDHSDSIQELQKNLNDMKFNVQIENMNQNFANLDNNLKKLNNNLNLNYSQIDNIGLQESQNNNVLEQIDSYHFGKNNDNDDGSINCHISILNNNNNNYQDTQKQIQNNDLLQSGGTPKLLQFEKSFDFKQSSNIDLSNIHHISDDKDILSQLEKEKQEFEQKLLEEKIKFEQRQLQLQQEFINQKQKLLKQQQIRSQQYNNSQSKQQQSSSNNQYSSIQNQQNNFSQPPLYPQNQQNQSDEGKDNSNKNVPRIPNNNNINNQNNNQFTMNGGQRINQFTDKSIDLSFTKNANLENDVSKLFKQEQISQILPGSQCSFLSECENLLENNSGLINHQIPSNQIYQQVFSIQDGIQTINLQQQTQSNKNNEISQNNNNINSMQKQNFFPPIISPSQSSTQFKDNDIMNQNQTKTFPNIHLSPNMVQISRQQNEQQYQNKYKINQQQQSVIEEQEFEQSSESPLKLQYSNKGIMQPPISSSYSNRMPPLPSSYGNFMKIKKTSSFHSNQFHSLDNNIDNYSSIQSNNHFNQLNQNKNISDKNINNYHLSQRIQTDPGQSDFDLQDEEWNNNLYSDFFKTNDEQNKQFKSNTQNIQNIQNKNNNNNYNNNEIVNKQYRAMTEPDDECFELSDDENQDQQQQFENQNSKQQNKYQIKNRKKIISLPRNCNSVINNIQQQETLSVKQNINQQPFKKFTIQQDSKLNLIAESIKKQKILKIGEKNQNFPNDFFPQSTTEEQKKINNNSLGVKKGTFNLQYKRFTNESSNNYNQDINNNTQENTRRNNLINNNNVNNGINNNTHNSNQTNGITPYQSNNYQQISNINRSTHSNSQFQHHTLHSKDIYHSNQY